MKRTRGLIAATAVALTLAGCQTGAEQVSHERMLRFFDDLAFGSDYALNRDEPKIIRKWSEPIRIDIADDSLGTHRAIVEAQAQKFAALSNIEVEVLTESSPTFDVRISFVEDESFLINREYVPCYASISDSYGTIILVRIFIGGKDDSLIEECVVHELMHGFGFGHHSGVIRSILSPLHTTPGLSTWDELALRTLYDPRLRPGMSREEALPIADTIIRELMSSARLAAKGVN